MTSVTFHVLYGSADGDGLIHRHREFDRMGDRGVQLRKGGADAVHGIDDIGAGLAENDHEHGGLAVQIAGLANVFHGIDGVADIADADGDAVSIGDHQRLVIDGVQDLIVGADFQHVGAIRKMAFGNIGVGAAEHGSHGFEADAVLVERGRIQFDAHTGQRAAAHHDLAHAADLGKLLRHHGGCRVVHLSFGKHVRGQPDDEDGRIGRIDFPVGRVARAGSPAGSCAPH